MPGSLTHSPADVIAQLLVDLAAGNSYGSSTWPVRVNDEVNDPDDVITVYDTLGTSQGREHVAGERLEHHGFQIRIRGSTAAQAYTRARLIAVALDRQVYDETVHVDSSKYLVHSVTRTGDVVGLGKEYPSNRRSIFTVNGKASIRQVS